MRRFGFFAGMIACLLLLFGTTAYGANKTLACCRKPDVKSVGSTLPTCSEGGYEIFKCQNCGKETRVLRKKALPHNWVLDHINRDDVDCAVGGTAYYHCTGCGNQRNEGVPPAEHTWVLDHINRDDVDCAVGGTAYYHCEVCGEQKNEGVPPAEHTWAGVAIQATCLTAEKAVYTCGVCGETMEETKGSPLGHDMQEQAKVAATCTASGKVSYKCSRCGEEENQTIPPVDHTMGEWVILRQPEGTTPGQRKATCTVCGYSMTEEFTGSGTEQKPVQKPVQKPEASQKPETSQEPENEPEQVEVQAEGYGVWVYVMAENVNLRSGPGVKHENVGKIAESNTLLGLLTQAALDEDDGVWFAAEYQGQEVWVSAQFSRAVVGEIDYTMARVPFEGDVEPREYHLLPGGMDLSNYYLRNLNMAAEALSLDETETGEDGLVTVRNWAMSARGGEYVEYITLQDGGYMVYGAAIGDSIQEADEELDEAGLYCEEKGEGAYLYAHLCSPDSLVIDENGFDSYIRVEFDQSGAVTQILWFPCSALIQ